MLPSSVLPRPHGARISALSWTCQIINPVTVSDASYDIITHPLVDDTGALALGVPAYSRRRYVDRTSKLLRSVNVLNSLGFGDWSPTQTSVLNILVIADVSGLVSLSAFGVLQIAIFSVRSVLSDGTLLLLLALALADE